MRKTIIRKAIEEFVRFWNEKKGGDGNIIPFPVKPKPQDNEEKEK